MTDLVVSRDNYYCYFSYTCQFSLKSHNARKSSTKWLTIYAPPQLSCRCHGVIKTLFITAAQNKTSYKEMFCFTVSIYTRDPITPSHIQRTVMISDLNVYHIRSKIDSYVCPELALAHVNNKNFVLDLNDKWLMIQSMAQNPVMAISMNVY